MNSSVKLYEVSTGCAKWKSIPLYFVAVVIAETAKAYYLYGHGTTETIKRGVCCVCGQGLTHPVSVELGIGPECGKHWWDWNTVGGYTKENVARLMQKIRQDIIIDSWIPKGLIVSIEDSIDTVTVPTDHPVLKARADVNSDKPQRTATMAENEHGDRVVKIKFPYNEQDLINIRTLSGRRFHADEKCWSAPVCIETVKLLKSWGFMLDSKLEIFLQKVNTHIDPTAIIDIPGLKGQLFPFQNRGVAFIESRDGRALIADEQGLGKTIEALAWLQLHRDRIPVIITCPASLKLNWKQEIETWLPNPKVEILSGETHYKITGDYIIINYDILPNNYETYLTETGKKKKRETLRTGWVDYIIDLKPQILIVDECQLIKNNSANRTNAILKLSKNTPYRLPLSGTPIENRTLEIYNPWKLADPENCPPFWTFAHRYCGAKHNGFGWDFRGASHTEELHKKLIQSCMIRRLKKDVLTDLPDIIHSFIPIELDNEKEYFDAERDFITFIKNTRGIDAAQRASRAEELAKMEGLKQLTIKGKLKGVIEWIDDFLQTDQKLVVFVTHTNTVNTLMTAFPNIAVKLDGSISNKQTPVDEFQNNPNIRLFIGILDTQGKPAGVGITLTAAWATATVELQWGPTVHDQADARVHRISQKNAVIAYYLLAKGTIDERIARLQDKKRKIIDAAIDGKVTETESLLTELINEYINDVKI